MNILYYLGSFPKLSTSFILNEIYELKRRGHEVAVFALNDPDEEVTHDELDEIDLPLSYADYPSYSDILELVSVKTLHPRVLKKTLFKAKPTNHAAALLRAKQCIEFVEDLEMDIDVVHTHFATLFMLPSIYVASFYQVPSTVTTHAFDLYNEPNPNYLNHIFRNVERIVTISEYNKRHIQRTFNSETPIDIVHAGIRPEKFDPSGGSVSDRILTVSRFTEKKGLCYAVRALSKVVEKRPAVEYHLVGSGPLEADIREEIARHGVEDNVRILGNVSDDQLISEYDEATCFLLPCVITESGNRDGIPVVLMESMAMRTPPVSTTVSGIPELIDHGENGLLVEPRNADALGDALVALLEDRSTQEEFADRGREKVTSQFDIGTEAGKLEAVFESVTRSNTEFDRN